MGFKRKRSSCNLSPSSESSYSSITGPHDAPASPSPFSAGQWHSNEEDTGMGGIEFEYAGFGAPAFHASDAHLNSRTRKRFRDNRPDESAIHESTISKLFLAQRPCQSSPSPPTSQPRPSSMSSASTRSHQASLHSFWALPKRPTTSLGAIAQPLSFASIDSRRKCEDCDAWVGSSCADGMDMDIGMDGEDNECCLNCGRVVCDTCAVVEIGRGRECLECKTRSRRWVGGIGWVA